MGKASRDKGKRGEREVAKLLQENGYSARRGQQFCGASGDADVIGVPGLHIEVKRTETLKLYEALKQSQEDAREKEVPTVWHRRNERPWVVILTAEEFLKLWRRAND